MLNPAQQFLHDLIPTERKVLDYKGPHAPRGTPPRKRHSSTAGDRGKRKRAAREAANDAYIEHRDNPDGRNARYANSSPERNAAKAKPWPARPKPKRRRGKLKPRPAESYRAARRNAVRERQRLAREQRAAERAQAAE